MIGTMPARWRVDKGQTDLEGDLVACRVSCMPSDGIITNFDGGAVEKFWIKKFFFLPLNVSEGGIAMARRRDPCVPFATRLKGLRFL